MTAASNCTSEFVWFVAFAEVPDTEVGYSALANGLPVCFHHLHMHTQSQKNVDSLDAAIVHTFPEQALEIC